MNLAVLGERNVERFGEYQSLVFEDSVFTNVELLGRASRLATALAGLGIEPGDRVGVLLPNSPAVPVAYGAILRVGGVVVPIVFLLAPPEVNHILGDSEAKAVFTSPEFLANVRAAIEGLPSPPIVICTGDAPDEPGIVSFDRLLEGSDTPHPIVDRDAGDLAVISYTSGTTGRPKGVMLTQSNLLFNAENTSKVAPTKDGDVPIATLPLAHLFGIGSSLVVQLFKVRSVLLPWFTAEGFFDAVTRHGATSAALVPTMVQYMLAHPGFDDVDWSGFEWTVVAAAPVPVEMADEFEKRTGAKVIEGYGLTETSPTTTLARLAEPRRPGSCGPPVPNVDVEIHDDDDHPLPPGEQGEVCIRGPNIMAGYYKMPEETAQALRNGWFHSGDIGYLDDEGYLYITDRKKDMIIRGGFNIYPRDVEEVLHAHPAVLEAGVVGLPDAKMGEAVVAFVVLRPGAQASAEELLEHCRERLARFKSPGEIRFIDVLPKNPVGKVLKRELRDRAKAEPSGAS